MHKIYIAVSTNNELLIYIHKSHLTCRNVNRIVNQLQCEFYLDSPKSYNLLLVVIRNSIKLFS